jgi:hypothetical protein
MARFMRTVGYRSPGRDSQPLYISRKSFAGQNDRVEGSRIGEDEATILTNVDIGVPGNTDKRPGLTLIANDTGTRTYALGAYYPTSGTPAIYRIEGTNTRKWTGSGNWSANLQTFTTGLDTSIIQGGESGENEVLFFQNGTDNPMRCNSSDTFQDLGSGATSPPKTTNQIWFNNRWWTLKDGFLYYSDAFSTDYSTAFAAANGFRFSGYGGDRGLFVVRDVSTSFASSIIVLMQNGIFGITPSATPASSDRPYAITTQFGAIDRKCIAQMGDDIVFLAPDGIRSLKRTVQDKLQFGTSYPLSYRLKTEFENINWAQSSKFHMIFWQDKLFFFFAAIGSSEIDRAWVYWPALDDGTGKGWAVITGWAITAATKFFVGGQEKLYGGSSDGKVYQLWTQTDDNGTAISTTIETRLEDFGQPALYKSGGELEVICETSGNYDITVSASIDGGSYTTLGTINLTNNSPSLPQTLPFTLAASARVSEKFHLDALGRFKQIQFKLENAQNNSTDIVRILEINCTTFPDSYESE